MGAGIKAKDMNKHLPEATAKAYEIVGDKVFLSPKVKTQYGMFDFTELSVKQASALVKLGCPWIAEKKEGTSSPDKGNKGDK